MKGLLRSNQFIDLANHGKAVLFDRFASLSVIEKDALALNIALCKRENLHLDAEHCSALLRGLLRLAKNNHRFVRVDALTKYLLTVPVAFRDSTKEAIEATGKIILINGVKYYAI